MRWTLETFLSGMETFSVGKEVVQPLGLETFLSGMETACHNLLHWNIITLKPSLVEWKLSHRAHQAPHLLP